MSRKEQFAGDTLPMATRPPAELAATVENGIPLRASDPGAPLLAQEGLGERYLPRALLGQGGMGEVRLCQDRRIGREVAMKVIRSEHGARADLKMRFLREARVQGRLEHPAVVPVYDLGEHQDGGLFFTMKRIRGVSLEEILRRQAQGDAAFRAGYSQRKLLQALSSACLAVDFAHRHGVVHRDLKPANIMLGDFGEVYVLDWGVAKVADAAEPAPVSTPQTPQTPLPERAAGTVEGQMMGTPGYMAPEQARGDLGALTPLADVYALGAILFEILTLEFLHRGDTLPQLLFSTLQGADARPSARRPGAPCPPELEAICVTATALGPQDRFPSARAMHEAVERYLDGDRDLALRRDLSQAHARRAAEAAGRAVEDLAARQQAMRELGRALALDPENGSAMETLVRLLTEPPQKVPPAVEEALARSAADSARFGNRLAGMAYLAWLGMLPLMLWMGIRQWGPFALCWLVFVPATGILNLLAARRQGVSFRLALLTVLTNTGGLLFASRQFGPFIMIPGIAAMTVLGASMHPDRRLRWLGLGSACLGVLVPAALEWLGLLPPSYAFNGGVLQVLPQMHALPQLQTLAFLLLTSLAVVVTGAIYVSHVRDKLHESERRMQLQTWHLRHLIPRDI